MNFSQNPRPLLSRVDAQTYYLKQWERALAYVNGLSRSQLARSDREILVGLPHRPLVPIILDRSITVEMYRDRNGAVRECAVYKASYEGSRSAWNLNPGLDLDEFEAGSIKGYLTNTHVAVVVKEPGDFFSFIEATRDVLQTGAALEAQLNELLRKDDAFGTKLFEKVKEMVDKRRRDPRLQLATMKVLLPA